MKVKVCSQCGHPNNPEEETCIHCGQSLHKADNPSEKARAVYADESRDPKTGLPVPVPVIIIVLTIILLSYFLKR